MIRIEQVIVDSAAESVGIQPQDQLLQINDALIGDIVDYYLALEGQTNLRLLIKREGEDPVELQLELVEDENPGLVPAHPDPARCGNDCLFCFVHQLPKGMRRTLYIKDEDYRYS